MRTSKSKLILVVDDSEDNRTLLETLFHSRDWNVYTAAHGLEALGLLKELSRLPDLMLLDLEMPVMNGSQFRAEQERDERLKDIPILVMSANDETKGIQTMFPDGFLSKPLSMRALVESVTSLI